MNVLQFMTTPTQAQMPERVREVLKRRPSMEDVLELAKWGPVFPVKIWWDKKEQKLVKAPAIAKEKGGRGHLDAVQDPEAVKALFARAAGWKAVGIPMGERSGLDALDLDLQHEPARAWKAQQSLPPTTWQSTPSGGEHHFFKHRPGQQNLESVPVEGVDVRGEGGWVVAWHLHDGIAYDLMADDAPWPEIGLPLTQGKTSARKTAGARPRVADALIEDLPLDRPSGIKAGTRDKTLYRWACKLFGQGKTFDQVLADCLKCNDSFDPPLDDATVTQKVESAAKYEKASAQVEWPDGLNKEKTRPAKTYPNTRTAIVELGVQCRYDEFHDYKLIAGTTLGALAGKVSDQACAVLRQAIYDKFGFDPGKEHVDDAVNELCWQNRFDPVRDKLSMMQKAWDGKKRLETCLIEYAHAADTPLTRAIGGLMFMAAARRVRQPGAKFDIIVVLESPEGFNKSKMLRLMALDDENFTDQTLLGLGDEKQCERIKGRLICEISDLAGMKKTEIEQVKAFASRQVDRVRLAWGRNVQDYPRRCIFVATTNDSHYLRSQTGNRRFVPIKVGRIDIDAFVRDLPQMWGEAAHWEAKGAPIELPPDFWEDARREQETRQELNPWVESLELVDGTAHQIVDGQGRTCTEYRVHTKDLWSQLEIKGAQQTPPLAKQLKRTMENLGWEHVAQKIRITVAGSTSPPLQGYRRRFYRDHRDGHRDG